MSPYNYVKIPSHRTRMHGVCQYVHGVLLSEMIGDVVPHFAPIPFKLLFWIPSSNPFGLEAMTHKYFAAKRVKNKGDGTEFFAMGAADIKTLPPALMMARDSKPRRVWRKRAEMMAARASVRKYRGRVVTV
jgi:hypothetical protein